jgi:hypothetical protein
MRDIDCFEIYSIFKDKTVALIGNSIVLNDCQLGSRIDSYDIVCRINKGPILQDKIKYGIRTDVLFYSDPRVITNDILEIVDSNTTFITSSKSGKITLFSNRPTYVIDKEYYSRITLKTGYENFNSQWPSNGLVAACLILDQNPKKITLFGFDWNMNRTFYKSRHKKKNRHIWDLEEKYLKSQDKIEIVNMLSEKSDKL